VVAAFFLNQNQSGRSTGFLQANRPSANRTANLLKFQGHRQRDERSETGVTEQSLLSATDQPNRTFAGHAVERPSCFQSQRQRDTRAQSK